MKRKWIHIVCWIVAVAAWNGMAAYAQSDVAASVVGAFSGSVTSGANEQNPSDAAGALIEVRHINSSWVGFEAAYSYFRASQMYTYAAPVVLPFPCPSSGCGPNGYAQPMAVSANAHAFTGDWIISRKMHNFSPFALAGVGFLLAVPSGGQMHTGTAAEFLLNFGAGVDWKLSSHLGLRLQDRVNLYKSPQMVTDNLYYYDPANLGGTYMHTQEPAIGVYYRF